MIKIDKIEEIGQNGQKGKKMEKLLKFDKIGLNNKSRQNWTKRRKRKILDKVEKNEQNG